MVSILSGLSAALNTLTIIPAGSRLAELHRALPWFPWVGAALGALMLGASQLLSMISVRPWPAGIAVLMVVLEVVLTRGLHLDGLADWADSIGGIFDRERRLAIMKDVHTGAFGVTALVVDILARWAAFDALIEGEIFFLIVPVMASSRAMMTELVTSMPYARSTQGMGAPFVAGASKNHRVLSLIGVFVICIPFGPVGVIVPLAGYMASRILRWYFLKLYGGITGDLLGATNEILEVVLLFALAIGGGYASILSGWRI